MGFVFQQPTLLKNLNILDNIILPSLRDKKKDVSRITEKARSLMKETGIGELEDRDISHASGGQLQRAGICRALMNDPRILFGDEPTGALNSKSAQEIMDIFTEINAQGTAVMLVTHDAVSYTHLSNRFTRGPKTSASWMESACRSARANLSR